jgi:alginate O-acetyltransferase complex protein AlgI
MINKIDIKIINIWIISILILIIFNLFLVGFSIDNIYSIKFIVTSSIFSLIIALVLNILLLKYIESLTYILFFSITFFSLLGLSKTLTGSPAETSSLYLYGLSFYTCTLAYYSKVKKLNIVSSFIATNPLLLITGPIATSFKIIYKKTLTNRINYYFPYIILGIFLHQIIATPLTQTFFLIKSSDLISTITYGLIFEIYVYCNFCGMSLIFYGLFGILGIRIPLNFKQPFSSTNLIDFWRGWHISFSIVLKELFYLPIKNKFGKNFAIICVFLFSALWHGVSINFLLWGLFHVICFLVTIIMLRYNIKYISGIILVLAIPFARILSSDDNFLRLSAKLKFNYRDFDSFYSLYLLGNHVKLAIFFGILFILSEIFFRRNEFFVSRNYKFYRLPISQLILIILIFLFIHNSGSLHAVYGQR